MLYDYVETNINIMKKLLTSLVVSAFLMSANAQYEEGTQAVFLNFGMSQSSSGFFDEEVKGFMVGVAYEKVVWEKLSVGINLTVIGGDGDFVDASGVKQNTEYTSFPTFLTARWTFLEGSFKPYLAAGLGAHYSTVSSTAHTVSNGTNTNGDLSDPGFAASGVVGFLWFLDDNFALNASYAPIYMNSDLFGDRNFGAGNLGIVVTWNNL